MGKFNYFLIVVWLWIGAVMGGMAQNRYDKDRLYNICPFKALDKALGYESGHAAGQWKTLDIYKEDDTLALVDRERPAHRKRLCFECRSVDAFSGE